MTQPTPTPALLPCRDEQEAFYESIANRYPEQFRGQVIRQLRGNTPHWAVEQLKGWQARGEYERTRPQPTHEAVEKVSAALKLAVKRIDYLADMHPNESHAITNKIHYEPIFDEALAIIERMGAV